MRGLIYLAAGLMAATPSLASIGWDWISGDDTTVYISNSGSSKGLVVHGGDTGIVAFGLPGVYAESWSGSYPAISAVGGTAVKAVANNIQGAAGIAVDAQGHTGGVLAVADHPGAYGVSGTSTGSGGVGVQGTANEEGNSVGVRGIANQWDGLGVSGTSEYGIGVQGSGQYTGVKGVSTYSWYDDGVRGYGNKGGVYGEAGYYGVMGQTTGDYGRAGVWGINGSDYGAGVLGEAWGYGSYAGEFYGNVAVWGDCDPCSPSDSRFKKNVQPLSGGLKKVMALKPKTYEMKTEEFKGVNFSKGTKYGLMAEDLAVVMPEIVHNLRGPGKKDDKGQPIKGSVGEDYKAVAYSRLIPVLISAIQELQAEVDALKKAR
jgi:hypothetical protein